MPDAEPRKQALELRVAIGQLARRIRKIYTNSPNSSDISFLEAALLTRLAREGPSSPTKLAGRERITSQAIAPVVTKLQQRRLIDRTIQNSDRRRVILTITDAGRRALDSNEQSVLEAMSSALQNGFTRNERRIIADAIPLLDKLTDLL